MKIVKKEEGIFKVTFEDEDWGNFDTTPEEFLDDISDGNFMSMSEMMFWFVCYITNQLVNTYNENMPKSTPAIGTLVSATGLEFVICYDPEDLSRIMNEIEDCFADDLDFEGTDSSTDETSIEFCHVRVVEFEDLVKLCHRLNSAVGHSEVRSSIYHYKNNYYLLMNDVCGDLIDIVRALALEYGSHTAISTAMLDEYGQQVASDDAIETIATHFALK